MKASELSPYELAFQAESGDSGAQYTLGMLFLLGEKVDQDLEAAHRWFSRAAEAHHPGAERLAKRLSQLKQNDAGEEVSLSPKRIRKQPWGSRFLAALSRRLTTTSASNAKDATPPSKSSTVADPA